MKRWLALLIGVLLTPLLGHAQSGAISGTAQSNNGGFSSPIGGATITVCPGASGTLTTPCASPTVSLYSDSLITMALPNPTTADGNGNFNFRRWNTGVQLLLFCWSSERRREHKSSWIPRNQQRPESIQRGV